MKLLVWHNFFFFGGSYADMLDQELKFIYLLLRMDNGLNIYIPICIHMDKYTPLDMHTCCFSAGMLTNFMLVCFVKQIPRDILLEILGPTKVYKEVITKIINSTIAEYVEQVTRNRFSFLILAHACPTICLCIALVYYCSYLLNLCIWYV